MTAVIAALSRELMYVWEHGRRWERVEAPCPVWSGVINGSEVLLVVSGMGQEAATRAVRWVLSVGQASSPVPESRTGRMPVQRAISLGFAGALTDLPIGTLIDAFSPAECTNYFAAAGYDASERIPL